MTECWTHVNIALPSSDGWVEVQDARGTVWSLYFSRIDGTPHWPPGVIPEYWRPLPGEQPQPPEEE